MATTTARKSAPAKKPTTAEIRAWAIKNYDGIGARGPIPDHVIADYVKTTRAAKK